MDNKHEHEDEQATSAASSPDAAESMAAPAVAEETDDPRLRRIMEYLRMSLDKEDALQANLNAASADLMVIGYKLATVIKKAMATAPASLEAYEELVPAIGNLLRIHKQVDRFSALDSRLASAQASVASLKAHAFTTVFEPSEDLRN